MAIQTFVKLASQMQARPVAHVAYLREAYVDPVSDNVRVTLDRTVRTESRHEPVFTTQINNPSLPFGDRVILEHLESKNGTSVMGEPIKGPRELNDGDEVEFGHVKGWFIVEVSDDPPTTTHL